MSFHSNVMPPRFGAGSSKLTEEQTREVEGKLGERYVRIQETPQYASRKERRRRRFRPRSERG